MTKSSLEIRQGTLTLPEIRDYLTLLAGQLQTNHEAYLDSCRDLDAIEEEYAALEREALVEVGRSEALKIGASSSKPDRALLHDERRASVEIAIKIRAAYAAKDPALDILAEKQRATAVVNRHVLVLKHLTTLHKILADIAMIELGIRKHTSIDGSP